jgi:hypothetical protein
MAVVVCHSNSSNNKEVEEDSLSKVDRVSSLSSSPDYRYCRVCTVSVSGVCIGYQYRL